MWFVYVILKLGGDSPFTGPPVNDPIQRTAHLFSVIPATDTKESMFRHQNVSSPATEIKPDILAPEASIALTTRLPCFSVFVFLR